jgi:hypothetical protein
LERRATGEPNVAFGYVSAKLDAAAVQKKTGDLPQGELSRSAGGRCARRAGPASNVPDREHSMFR